MIPEDRFKYFSKLNLIRGNRWIPFILKQLSDRPTLNSGLY